MQATAGRGFSEAVKALGSKGVARGFGLSFAWASPQGAIRMASYETSKDRRVHGIQKAFTQKELWICCAPRKAHFPGSRTSLPLVLFPIHTLDDESNLSIKVFFFLLPSRSTRTSCWTNFPPNPSALRSLPLSLTSPAASSRSQGNSSPNGCKRVSTPPAGPPFEASCNRTELQASSQDRSETVKLPVSTSDMFRMMSIFATSSGETNDHGL